MAAAAQRTVLVTGATGLLGRAVVERFAAAGWRVVAASHSRAVPTAGAVTGVQADLRSPAACAALVRDAAPHVVVHAAAERHPDVCERDPAGSEVLNIDAVWQLGRAASAAGAGFVHVSTDYLWDGTAAPYKEDAPACPLNEYGRQKLRGEHAALAAHAHAVVLRVPVLYGPTTDLPESAVTMFAATVLAPGKPATVDDWQIRVPTYTPDIGATLVNIAGALTADGSSSAGQQRRLPGGVYHYSSADRFTRWGLVQAFAAALGLPTDHVTRLEGQPPGAPRPYDCQLDCTKLAATGLAAPCTPFAVGARAVLAGAGCALAPAPPQ